MAPVHVAIQAQRMRLIHQVEQVGRVGAGVLEIETAVDHVLAVDHLVEPRLQAVLVRRALRRNLVIVSGRSGEIGLRIKAQQVARLRADEGLRDQVSRKTCDLHRLAVQAEHLRQIAGAFGLGGHQTGLHAVIVIPRPLIGDEDSRPIVVHARDLERTAESAQASEAVVGKLGAILAGDGERAGVQVRIVHREADAAVVEPAAAGAEVAECGRLAEGRIGGVVYAAIDEEAVARLLAGLGHGLAVGFLVHFGGIGRCVHIRFLKALLRRSHRGNRVLLAANGGHRCWRGHCRGRLRLAGGRIGRHRRCGWRSGAVHLRQRKHLQLPFGAGRGGRHRYFALDRRKAQHLDANRPDSFGEVRERVGALLVRHRSQALAGLGRGHRDPWHRQAVEGDSPVVLHGRQIENRHQQKEAGFSGPGKASREDSTQLGNSPAPAGAGAIRSFHQL